MAPVQCQNFNAISMSISDPVKSSVKIYDDEKLQVAYLRLF